MRLASLIIVGILILSCKKEVHDLRYTSDAPSSFETDVSVRYDQNENLTGVSVTFIGSVDNHSKGLILPAESYFEYNGQQLQADAYKRYRTSFQGNENAVVKFQNFDGKMYSNAFSVPDTAYFVDLPDTLSADQDLTLYFGGPELAHKENWTVSFIGKASHSCDDGYYSASTKENSTTILKHHFEAGESYEFTLTRGKRVDCISLPGKGGSIIFKYVLRKTVYLE